MQLGAQFIHHRDNSLYALLQSLNLIDDVQRSIRYNDHSLHTYLTEPHCPEIAQPVIDKYLSLVEAAKDYVYRSDLEPELNSASVGELFEKVFQSGNLPEPTQNRQLKSLLHYWRKFTEADSACSDWHKVSFKYFW